MNRLKQFPCACAFAKTVDDRNPFHFPRVGIADNVLYRGRWIIHSLKTGDKATINTPETLGAEAQDCCWDWFDTTVGGPTIARETQEGDAP